MSLDAVVLIAPAAGFVGVVVGAALNQRFAARTSRDNWRRDALLKVHNEIADCISSVRIYEKDPSGIEAFRETVFPLRTRAAVLNSQCTPILDEMLDDATEAIKAYRQDRSKEFVRYALQFHVSQEMLLRAMQDELEQKRINPKRNDSRNLAIKQKFMDGKLL